MTASTPFRARSRCHKISASPKRAAASHASCSSHEPGKRMTPKRVTRLLDGDGEPKSEDAKEEGPGKCFARPGPDDAGRRSFAGSSVHVDDLEVLDERVGQEL